MLRMSMAVVGIAACLGSVNAAHAQGVKTIYNNSGTPITVTLTPSGLPAQKAVIKPFTSHTFNYDTFAITTLTVTEKTAVDSASATFKATATSSTLPNIDHTFNDNGTITVSFNPATYSFGLSTDQ